MKKLSELFEELGFEKDGSDSVKEAFIKHLIRASTGQVVQTPTEAADKTIGNIKNRLEKASKNSSPRQLSFDFEQSENPDPRPANKVS